MKTIRNLKDVTTLEVGDKVVFGNLEHKVKQSSISKGYYLYLIGEYTSNEIIFNYLNLNKRNFIESIGINARIDTDFPEVRSLEALTAIVSALFKEYEKQNQLPKTWEEFCERYPIKEKEAFINSASDIVGLNDYFSSRKFRLCDGDKNLCTSKQEAEAILALMQILQLHKCYVGDWEPDWISDSTKYCIEVVSNELVIQNWYHKSHILSFPTRKLAEQFLTNFKELLETAKVLL